MGAGNFSVAAYQEHVSQRKLMASRCGHCQALYLPPKPICSACHTQDMAWQELKGEGTIIGFTSIAIVPTAMAAKGFGRDKPYLTAIVSLAEGPTITARVEVSDSENLERSVEVGTPVRAYFPEETVGEEKSVTLVFRPRGSD